MTLFSELGITPTEAAFVGKQIEVDDVLNQPIVICDFKIKDSKYPKKGREKCLHLQIEKDGDKKVMFTPSNNLMDMIQKIPKERFPVKTTITKTFKRLDFT